MYGVHISNAKQGMFTDELLHQMANSSSSSINDATKASLSNIQASRIPLMQRLNQHFLIESRFLSYSDDILRLGTKNRSLLLSLKEQEARLKALHATLHPPPPLPTDDKDKGTPSGLTQLNTSSSCCMAMKKPPVEQKRSSINDTQSCQTNLQDISIDHRVPTISSNDCDKHDHRRSQFFFRIASLKKSIEEMESIKKGIPAQQAYLTRKMLQQQERIVSLISEIERVAPLEDSPFVTSHLLHACNQTFIKKQLIRRLQLEMTSCRNDIATSRMEIVGLIQKSDHIVAGINKKREQLNERKAALLQYEKRCAIVSKMRMDMSKQPDELQLYYLSVWRNEAAEHKKERTILSRIVASRRRRIYTTVWNHLRRLRVSEPRVGEGGIGSYELLLQEARLKDNIEEGAVIVRKLKNGRTADAEYVTTNLLRDEDAANFLRGEFLFNGEHYEASLKCYERVESAISCNNHLSGTSLSTAIELRATVTNKIGHIHLAMKSVDLAIVYFGRELSLAQEENLEMHRISALIGLGKCYMKKHDFNYARYFLQESLPFILSRCCVEKEKIVYSLLQQCYEHLNKPDVVAFYSKKIHDMRDTHIERVSSAISVIDALTQRLINVSASKSRVVKVQTFSAKSVSLTKQIKAKEIEVSDANKALRESRDFFSQLMELDEELRNELEAAIDAKKDRIISFRIHNSSQEIKKKELLFRLEEKLKMTRVEQEECDRKIHSLERTVCNLNDDLIELREEMALEERPLIDRVLNQRSYRCVAMNSSNTASQNDVTGGNGCSEYVALSNGKECYIHDINSGELQTVFMGDNKGRHVGPLVGHSATITAMYFHDKNVYTGSLDASIICWKIDSTAKLFECKGHEGAITCIFSDGAKTLSGSADKTIIVWSSEGLLLHRITGHVGGVHHIQCCLSWFVSSSYEKIFVWELINLQDSDKIIGVKCRQSLTSTKGNVSALQLFGGLELVTGDSVGYLKIWNIKSAEVVTSLKAHESSVTSLQVDATKAVSCCLEMIVQVTDIVRGSILQTLRGHAAPILALAFDQMKIVSVSSDGEVRIWSWTQRPSRPCIPYFD